MERLRTDISLIQYLTLINGIKLFVGTKDGFLYYLKWEK